MKFFKKKFSIDQLKKQVPSFKNIKRIQFPKNFDAKKFRQLSLDWLNHSEGKLKGYLNEKNLPFIGKVATVILSTYFLSDVTSLLLEDLVPSVPKVKRSVPQSTHSSANTISDYESIYTRNLFNSKGLIPGEGEQKEEVDLDGPAIKTTLPLELIGTLVLQESKRSVAAIQDKSKSKLFPVYVGDEIPNVAKIEKIEARKVTFRNLRSRRLEYVDLPEDTQLSAKLMTPSNQKAGIEKVSGTRFQVSRSEIDKNLANLNQVLTQARAIPHLENGVPAGYKLFQIVPGSIYDKLGLKNGDVISGINGDPVKDPGQAFSMMNELRTANFLELNIKRGGRDMTLTYDIN